MGCRVMFDVRGLVNGNYLNVLIPEVFGQLTLEVY